MHKTHRTERRIGISKQQHRNNQTINNAQPKTQQYYNIKSTSPHSTMMKRRILLLRHILHRPRHLRLAHQRLILRLAILSLFILLRHITRGAAASAQAVFAGITLEMVLCAHVAAIEHRHDEGDSYAAQTAEAHALGELLVNGGRRGRVPSTLRLQHE
jgi:hypothetical protein